MCFMVFLQQLLDQKFQGLQRFAQANTIAFPGGSPPRSSGKRKKTDFPLARPHTRPCGVLNQQGLNTRAVSMLVIVGRRVICSLPFRVTVVRVICLISIRPLTLTSCSCLSNHSKIFERKLCSGLPELLQVNLVSVFNFQLCSRDSVRKLFF